MLKSIAFDIDDTVSNTMEVLRRWILLEHNIDITEYLDCCIYDSVTIPGLSKWELLDTIQTTLSRHYTQIKPEPHVMEYLPKFQSLYGELNFVTGRSKRLSNQTELWFDYTFGRRALKKSIVYTDDKSEYIRCNKISYFVEDRVKYVKQCLPHVEKVFLIDKPWNSGFEHEKVIVVKNIKEVYERIEDETRND